MTFVLNMMVGFSLTILQAVVVPQLPIVKHCYDLLLPFIIYLGIFRTFGESMILTCGLGLMMDQLSGAPVGLFLITYLWILVAIRWGVKFLHMGNYLLTPFVVVIGVLLENLLFSVSAMIHTHIALPPWMIGRMVSGQVGWALISAPLFMMLLDAVHHGWAAWIGGLNTDKGHEGV